MFFHVLQKSAVDYFPIIGSFGPTAYVSGFEFYVSEFGVKSRISFRLKKDPDFFQL